MTVRSRLLTATALVALAANGCAATSLLGYKVAPDYPDDAKEERQLAGLTKPVSIRYDGYGIPHIKAENLADLARATGYAQGRDRFFEMDMLRRFASGRLAELVGEQPVLGGTTVDFDRTMRGWGFLAAAKTQLPKLPADELALLQAFTDGANQAVKEHLPIEYRLLRVEPEPWTVEDGFAVGLLNAWSVSHNWHQEAARLVLAMNVGLARANAIFPSERAPGATTLPGKAAPRELPPAVPPELEAMFPAKIPAPQLGQAEHASSLDAFNLFPGASNAWAVAGARSVSGKPVLANDPHLSHLVPSIVYQEHLTAPGLDVVGVAVPGLPWVLAGHNHRVAWGMTSTVADVMDLVIEQPVPGKDEVAHEGHACAITTREETLKVREGGELKARTVKMRATCNGPVLNDFYPDVFDPKGTLVVVRWKLDGTEKSLPALRTMAMAGSVGEFQEALRGLPLPVNTWTAADVDGHIGVAVSGLVPIRKHHLGTFPTPGWVGKYEWNDGYADAFGLPRGIDPEEGLLVHANNLMVDPATDDQTLVHVDSAPAYRIERIRELLLARPKHDVPSLAAIQLDQKELRGVKVAPFMNEDLKGEKDLGPAGEKARALLAAWDGVASADSSAAAIFFATWRACIFLALDDELPGAKRDFFLAQRYSTAVADRWFEKSDHPVWDDLRTPGVETRATVVTAAFKKAVAELTVALGDDPAAWRWGALHTLEPRHAFGGKSALAGMVNLPPLEAGGGLDSIWKSHFDLANEKAPFKPMAGPVMRMVVDLADLAHGQWVIDTGASGWPKSPHYGDQYEKWRKGELVPMVFEEQDVEKSKTAELTLVPAR